MVNNASTSTYASIWHKLGDAASTGVQSWGGLHGVIDDEQITTVLNRLMSSGMPGLGFLQSLTNLSTETGAHTVANLGNTLFLSGTGITSFTIQDATIEDNLIFAIENQTIQNLPVNLTGSGVSFGGRGSGTTYNISSGDTVLFYVRSSVVYPTLNFTSDGATPSPSLELRYGLSTESNAASVVFSSLTDVASPTNPQTVSTGTTTAGQYFYIFSANTHNIETIRDTVLDQIVYQEGGASNIFVKVSDVRTESSITYDSYRIGPLNAGVNEDYVLTFTTA